MCGPDGIKIADATAIANGDALDSGIWQHADGSYVGSSGNQMWTGSMTPSMTGTHTCGDSVCCLEQ